LNRLIKVLLKINTNYEIIFINDGSTDNSLEILLSLKKKNNKIKIISFESNLGQTIALQRGFKHAKGSVIITLDADLQNSPEDIPKLLKYIKNYDIVCGWRKKRKDKLFSKKIPSLISNLIIKILTGYKIKDSGCSLRIYNKKTIGNLHLFGEMHRFIPILLAIKGYKIKQIPVKHSKRKYGFTKYGPNRFYKGILDLIFLIFLSKYQRRPLHFFGFIGILLIFLGISLFTLDIIFLLFYLNIPLLKIGLGPSILISFLLIFFGFNFLILGFMSEMIFYNHNQKINEKIL
jgi:glycosyltransferase involved in cell wall biosynthesis